jgi:hypothetical protein
MGLPASFPAAASSDTPYRRGFALLIAEQKREASHGENDPFHCGKRTSRPTRTRYRSAPRWRQRRAAVNKHQHRLKPLPPPSLSSPSTPRRMGNASRTPPFTPKLGSFCQNQSSQLVPPSAAGIGIHPNYKCGRVRSFRRTLLLLLVWSKKRCDLGLCWSLPDRQLP